MKPYYSTTLLLITFTISATPPPDHARPLKFGLGKPADPHLIQQLDKDVRPDGQGLPPGSGSVTDGEKVYQQHCITCHGKRGEGGISDKLAGRLPDDHFPFSSPEPPKETIGNYWPYATTLFDYIRRTMPYSSPGSLSDCQVYSVVAYLLYLNDIIEHETVLDKNSLAKIIMPARHRFKNDDRLQFNRAH
ncbi:c-type cytochrome [Endozoicomonas euniceicola]|uniref:Cytochrome c n=1 Tax=Endozoicomonas euniceicola TaxID=1234143 RepID=A0ABY6GY13_9GAMM|nr:cytochrome c [Endozoicomonas euniceicola]UYM17680.1 cytochrome c [Endozoicomonas euniceicola]